MIRAAWLVAESIRDCSSVQPPISVTILYNADSLTLLSSNFFETRNSSLPLVRRLNFREVTRKAVMNRAATKMAKDGRMSKKFRMVKAQRVLENRWLKGKEIVDICKATSAPRTTETTKQYKKQLSGESRIPARTIWKNKKTSSGL